MTTLETFQMATSTFVVIFLLITALFWLVLPFVILSKFSEVIRLLRALKDHATYQSQMADYKEAESQRIA